jgi:hypothetical protein
MHRYLPMLAAVLVVRTALASPTIVRDSRVTDTGTTPFLGRGYSLATNTFQSACLKDVVITEPSYDFQYLFKELESSSSSSEEYSMNSSGKYSSWFVRGEFSSSMKGASSRGRTAHSIVVTLNMDTYYASVNESGTPLSEAASSLLVREDLPGFFAACGPYYVRGINRNAQLVSLFTYETQSSSRDFSFEASLKANLRGFFVKGSINVQASGKFSEESASKSLTITTRGWGLGKNEDASLISYDLDTFKAAVKQAFISMQNPLTGRVTSLEVVPWVENTEFQNKVNMTGSDLISGKEVQLYEKKDILTMNGEFLAEMERAARARLNSYYTAKMCKNWLLSKWSIDGQNLLADVASQKLKNHRLGPAEKSPITAGDLLKAVDDNQSKKLWDEYEKFIVKGSPNVRVCIDKLMADPSDAAKAPAAGAPKAPGAGGAVTTAAVPAIPDAGTPPVVTGMGRGLFLKRFIDHNECIALQAQFVPAKPNFEDYCMPSLISEP